MRMMRRSRRVELEEEEDEGSYDEEDAGSTTLQPQAL